MLRPLVVNFSLLNIAAVFVNFLSSSVQLTASLNMYYLSSSNSAFTFDGDPKLYTVCQGDNSKYIELTILTNDTSVTEAAMALLKSKSCSISRWWNKDAPAISWFPGLILRNNNESSVPSHLQTHARAHVLTLRAPTGLGRTQALTRDGEHAQFLQGIVDFYLDHAHVVHYRFLWNKRWFFIVSSTDNQTFSSTTTLYGSLETVTLKRTYEAIADLPCPHIDQTARQNISRPATAVDVIFDGVDSNFRVTAFVAFARPHQRVRAYRRLLCTFDLTPFLPFSPDSRSPRAETFQPIQPTVTAKTTTCKEIRSPNSNDVEELVGLRIDDQAVVLHRDATVVQIESLSSSQAESGLFSLTAEADLEEQGTIRAMAVSGSNTVLDILTDNKVFQWDLNPCRQFSNCQDCVSSGTRFCGWCVLEKRCSIEQTCVRQSIPDKVQLKYWHRASAAKRSCPRIEQVGTPFYGAINEALMATDQPVTLDLIHYEQMDRHNLSAVCTYDCKGCVPQVAVWSVVDQMIAPPRLLCPLPSAIRIPPSRNGDYFAEITVNITVGDGQRAFPLHLATLLLYESCNKLDCSRCVTISVGCLWNIAAAVCQASSTNESAFTLKQSEAWTCQLNSTSPKDILAMSTAIVTNYPNTVHLSEKSNVTFYGRNLHANLTIFIGNNDCVVTVQSMFNYGQSMVICEIDLSDALSGNGSARIHVQDADGTTVLCNCSVTFIPARWARQLLNASDKDMTVPHTVTSVLPRHHSAILHSTTVASNTNYLSASPLFVGVVGGIVLTVGCFFVYAIFQTYRKLRKCKTANDVLEEATLRRLNCGEIELTDHIRNAVIRAIPHFHVDKFCSH